MGIYTRDNINYQGMIANMLANRQHGAEIRSNAMRNQGQMWGDTISGIGNTFGNALMQYGQQSDAAKQQELENSWRAQQLDFQNRQLEQQKDLQLKQMDLSRELANQQKAETAAANQDENMKNWQIANARLNAAKAELDRNPTNPQLKQAAAEAEFNANYWRKKAGVIIPESQPVQTVPQVPPAEPVSTTPVKTNEDYLAEIKAALETGDRKWSNADLAAANELLEQIQDPKMKADAVALIKAKGDTAEVIAENKAKANAALNAKIDSAISMGDDSKLPSGYILRSYDDGRWVVKKDKAGNWVKVKKWGK